ncbi:hypothetical protein [Halomonas binhaiensis]|uniref:Uncharacterized protein n=1 Tax=Halomonas binhaiensis TaxID=2562282 RepID=A0A5C1NFS3_9GAMM|nr:hypothetical protein [Halomonas binhaiensis]QEM81258.1 hypothetical protein E4T21_06710 [Halomonas binhaiensis]
MPAPSSPAPSHHGQHHRRILLKALFSLVLLMLVAISWWDAVDHTAQRHVESATTQALVAYAAARGLNAGISVLQSSEVGLSLGAGVSTRPFEILDPFNDLVEQYADIMMLAIGSLVGQNLLLEISATPFFKATLSITALLLLASVWLHPRSARWCWKLFVLVCLPRFLVLITLLLNTLVSQAFLDEPTERNMAQVNILAEEVQTSAAAPSADHLTAKERERLEDEITQLTTQRREVRDDLVEVNQRLTVARNLVTQSRARIAMIKADMSLSDLLNPFHTEPRLEELEARLARQSEDLETATEEHQAQLAELARLDKQRESVRRHLAGEDQGFIDRLGDKLSTLSSTIDTEAIQARIESGTSAVLHLMALFVFQTLIFPLGILWLTIKLFRVLFAVRPIPLLPQDQPPERLSIS